MLLLAFKHLGRSRVLGPVQAIEFRGSELFIDGGATAAGTYLAGYWAFDNERWTYAECQARVEVRLQDHSGRVGKTVGQRPSLRLRDRFIFAGRERVATLLPGRARWQGVGSQQSWPIVRVVPYRSPE